MHSTPLLIAAVAAVAAATPLGSGAGSNTWGSNSTSQPQPTSTGSYSTTTSYGWSTQVLGVPTASPNPVPSSGVVAKLITDATTVDRFADIADEIKKGDLSLVFDLNPAANPKVKPGDGGQVDTANRGNFPILTGLGISAAGLFYKPCGLNPPHIHPRATEVFTVVTENDYPISTGFVLENGEIDQFSANLTQYQTTVFPMGSIHFQQNLDCKPAVAIAGFNNEDPGASTIAPNFLKSIDGEVVRASLGFSKEVNADNFRDLKDKIPAPFAKGVEECLIRCKIPY